MAHLSAYKYKPQINDIRLVQQLDVYVCVRIFALPKYFTFNQRHAQILSISLTEISMANLLRFTRSISYQMIYFVMILL